MKGIFLKKQIHMKQVKSFIRFFLKRKRRISALSVAVSEGIKDVFKEMGYCIK
jgi:hypothetical protein